MRIAEAGMQPFGQGLRQSSFMNSWAIMGVSNRMHAFLRCTLDTSKLMHVVLACIRVVWQSFGERISSEASSIGATTVFCRASGWWGVFRA